MRKIVIIVAVLVALVACAARPSFDYQNWDEDVQLRSGEIISVKRAYIPGEVWYAVNGSPSYRREQTLELPDGLTWNTKLAKGTTTFREPLLVDRDGRSWLIAVRLSTPQHGTLLFMRSNGNSWVTIAKENIPAGLKCNLATVSHRFPVERVAHLTLETKNQLILEWAKNRNPRTRGAADEFCHHAV